MRCTNYSIQPFKFVRDVFNSAAADYLASVMETDQFQQWYGKRELDPKMLNDSPWVVNINGDQWDIMSSLNAYEAQEEIRAGFRYPKEGEHPGNRIVYDIDLPGIYEKLNKQISAYNAKSGPFKAQLIRTTDWREGASANKEVYAVMLGFNKQYRKEEKKGLIAADGPTRPEVKNIFHMDKVDEKALASGKQNLFVRQDVHREGVYKIGDGYYRIKLRGNKPIHARNSGITSASLRLRTVDDGSMSLRFMEDFYSNKLPMFLYDVTKVNSPEAEVKAMPDFVGVMAIRPNKKARGARFLTGYADVDKYIKALVEHRTALYRQRATLKSDLKAVQDIDAKIRVTNEQIDRLKQDPNVDVINFVGRNMMLRLKRDLDNANTFDDMNEALRLSKAWSEIGEVIEFLPTNPSDEDLATLQDAKEVRDMAVTLFQAYFNKFKDKMLDLIDDELDASTGKTGKARSLEVVDENGKLKLMDVNKSGAATISQSFSANPIEQLMNRMLEHARFEALAESNDFERRLDEATVELLGKTAKDSKASDLNFLFRKDVNGNAALITKYDSKFYKELYIKAYLAFDKVKMSKHRSDNYTAAVALGATAEDFNKEVTIDDYYKFERQYFDYDLTEEGKQEFENYMHEQEKSLITGYDEENNPIYDQKALDRIRKEYDPESFKKWLTGDKSVKYNRGSRWFTKRLKGAPLSSEYQNLTDKQRTFYNFFTKEFIEGQQELVRDYRFTDSDMDKYLLEFVMGASQELKEKIKYMGQNFRKFVGSIAGVTYTEDPEVVAPSRALTGVEHIAIDFKPVTDFIPDSRQLTTAHPLHILSEFRRAGHNFKHKRAIEDALNAIRDLTLDAERIETTPDGRVKNDILGKVFSSKHKTNIADRVEFNVKAALTDKRTEPYKTDNKGGKPGEWKYSSEAVTDSLNNFTRFRAMALSPLSATGNLLMGTVNNMIYAASGQYFNDKELAHGYWLIKTSVAKYWSHAIRKGTGGDVGATKTALKIAAIMRRFGVLGDVTEHSIHGSDLISAAYTLQSSGEYLSQGATMIAQLLRQKVELADGSSKSVWELFELDDHNNLNFRADLTAEDSEWRDNKRMTQLFAKIIKVNQRIHGDYHNPMMIKKDVLGRVFLLFRTWLPMAIKERFGKEYHDADLGAVKGRYVSAAQITSRGLRSLISKDFAGAADFGKLIAKLLLPIIGRKIKLSEGISEVDRNNIQMFVREMHFLMALTMACLTAKAALGDEDDENHKSELRYIYNQMERAQSELSFFFYPTDTMQIIRDVIPLYSTLRDGTRVMMRGWHKIFNPEDDFYKRGFRKGDSKFFTSVQEFLPVTRSLQKSWSAASQTFSDKRYQ
jgi:hypothetical protein